VIRRTCELRWQYTCQRGWKHNLLAEVIISVRETNGSCIIYCAIVGTSQRSVRIQCYWTASMLKMKVWVVLGLSYNCCRSERALSERARQQTKIVQLLKISILLEPQSMLVESHFTNMQRAAIRAAIWITVLLNIYNFTLFLKAILHRYKSTI
jgi:hypothetical protein